MAPSGGRNGRAALPKRPSARSGRLRSVSAALSHVAVGLLLGLALGVRLRWLPVAGLLALLPDVDHLSLFTPIPLSVLRPRYTLHNVWFCVLLPIVVYLVVLRAKRVPDDA